MMDQTVQLATSVLRDLKGISEIQQALMFLGGASGAVVGGLLGCTTAEATAAGVGAVGSEAAAVGVGAVGVSGASPVMFMGIGALTGVLLGLGIGTAVQAYLNNQEKEKLRKKLEMQKEQRLKRIMKNSKDLIAIVEEDDLAEGKRFRKFILFYEKGVFTDDTFLDRIQQMCLEYSGLSIEQVKALVPLPV